MSTCSVATGLLAAVAVIHIVITIVLTALVILVRCYCKQRTQDKVCPTCNQLNPPHQLTETSAESEDHSKTDEGYHHRRIGITSSPPLVKVSSADDDPPEDDKPEKVDLTLSFSQRLDSEIYDNQGVSENWVEEESEPMDKMKNKTIEELRRDSLTKKPGSPFRRISSPLTRSGRFSIASITSKMSRKSVDMEPESVSLMSPGNEIASPLDEQPQLAADLPGESSHDVVLEICNDDADRDAPPPIVILQTSPDHPAETEC